MVCLFNLIMFAFDQLDNNSTVVGGNEYSNGGSTKCMIYSPSNPRIAYFDNRLLVL